MKLAYLILIAIITASSAQDKNVPKEKVSEGVSKSLNSVENTKDIAELENFDESEEQKPVLVDIPDLHQTVDEGIQIHVEKITNQSGDETGDITKVEISAPWPAKPLIAAPSGWQLIPAPDTLEDYKTKVELGNGKIIELSITPYVLNPMSGGVDKAVRVAEPGYVSTLQGGNRQTVGKLLEKMNTELEQNEKKAATVISDLQQLLSSLPK